VKRLVSQRGGRNYEEGCRVVRLSPLLFRHQLREERGRKGREEGGEYY